MKYDYKSWKSRMSDRQDLSSSLVHLTRANIIGEENYSAVDILFKILRDKKIIGSTAKTGFIRGNQSAVCFQDAPLYSIAQNIKYEKNLSANTSTRYRYSGCGLIFSKYQLFKYGCRPVIYDKIDEGLDKIEKSELYRLVALDLSNTDSIIDWSHEREWRMPGNFDFSVEWSAVVLETKNDYYEFIKKAKLPENKGILEEICGIIVLDALLM